MCDTYYTTNDDAWKWHRRNVHLYGFSDENTKEKFSKIYTISSISSLLLILASKYLLFT